ncbi:MAG: LPS-assembly protein LptD [Dictyoglomus sp.]|uniref:LPS-assembly protein LptD n=1 Tax=Dictyoglomus sp. TaxID=28205 RepID=UPI003D0BCA90
MEGKKVVKFLLFILLIFLFVSQIAFSQESSWKIKAEKISFNWESQEFEAEGKVEFLGKDIWLKADYIKGNVKEGFFEAKKNVTFKDKNGEFSAEYMEYYYKEEKAFIKSVKVTYPVSESEEKMYIKGEEVKWEKGNVDLKKGNFTTCSYEKPHYYISSSQIEYFPNDKIIFINVLFWLRFPYPYFYIPIFYVPYYVLPLTKEPSPFPQFGHDPNLGLYFSYPFTYSLWGLPGVLTFLISQNQGVQFTLNQKYHFPNLSGSIDSYYLYNYLYNTDQFKFSLSGIYKPSSNFSLSFNTNYLLYPYSQNYSLQSSSQLTYTQGSFRSNIRTNYNKTPSQDNFNTTINSSIELGSKTNLSTNISYNSLNILGNNREDLQGNVKFEFNDQGQILYIFANNRWTNVSDFLLKKLPEIYYGRDFNLLGTPSKIEFLFGNYIEPSYPFTIKTWKLGYYLSFSPKFNLSFMNINTNMGYKQEFYGTQDARYILYANLSSNYKFSPILSGTIAYNFQWLGKDILTGELGNSPFYFDYLSNLNNLNLTLNLGTPDIGLSLQESYNFITKTLSPLSISGLIRSGNTFVLTLRTSFNFSTLKLNPIFLQGTIQYPWFSLGFGSLYDINLGMFQRLDYRLTFKITGDWHYAGNITLTGYYLPSTGNTLYSLSLNKDLHCFNAKLIYYFSSRSFQFSLSLKAFPTKGIEFIGKPEGFTLLPSF